MMKTSRATLAVICLQFGVAGMAIIAKFALNQGMSPHVLAAYRHVVATIAVAPFAFFFDRKVRPKMTLPIFFKIVLLGLLEPVVDQNFFFTGMKYTSATFTAAMANILPAFAFLMAWLFRLETVNIRKIHSMAKIIGTVVTVLGAMLMTIVKGPIIPLPWTNTNNHQETSHLATKQEPIKGAVYITIGCVCLAGFFNLQAITLKSYPAELSLTALICLSGAIQGTIAALVIEKGNFAAWSIQLDSKLLAAVYSGVICSGLAYYVQGVIMKTRGPVFVTAFNPLNMVIVAILGSFILAEVTYLGSIIGSIVIVLGVYSVLWGKSKDEPASFSDIDKDKELPVISQIQQVETTIISTQANPEVEATTDVKAETRPPDESV